jgi:hypothetical protein
MTWRKPAKGPPRGNLEELSRRDDFPEIMREMHSKMSGGKGDRIRRGISHDAYCEKYEKINWDDGYDTDRRDHGKYPACRGGYIRSANGDRRCPICEAAEQEG